MSCSDWEERIALYAGGDLSSSEVEQHLKECSGCQVLLSGLRENLGLLREAHEEAIDTAHYAAVRARVLSELERGRGPWWKHAWVYAMAVAALVLLVAVWPKHVAAPVQTVQTPAVATVPARVETSLHTAGTSAHATPAPPRNRKARRKPAAETIAVNAEKPMEPIVVKLITDDPDVIIYWIADTKGE